MKNKMPLDGLGLNHDSGSVLCNMLKSHVLGQPGGGGVASSFVYCRFTQR